MRVSSIKRIKWRFQSMVTLEIIPDLPNAMVRLSSQYSTALLCKESISFPCRNFYFLSIYIYFFILL